MKCNIEMFTQNIFSVYTSFYIVNMAVGHVNHCLYTVGDYLGKFVSCIFP